MGARNILRLINEAFTQTTDNLDLDGNELVLDADADTSITADTDDQIDVKVGGSDTAAFFATGFQNRGVQAVTANGTDHSAPGLISQGTSFVVASGSAGAQIALPAAEVGDEIWIQSPAAALELVSAVTAHKVNGVQVGATNEALLPASQTYCCKYVAANEWIVVGYEADGDRAAKVAADGA